MVYRHCALLLAACGGGSAVSRHSALAVVACGERRWFPGLCCFQAVRRWMGGLWGTVSISRHCAFATVAVVSGIGFQALRPCVGGLWGNSAVSRHCAAGAERCWFPGIASLNGWHVWDGVHFQVSRCPGLGRCLFVTSHVYGLSWRIFAEYVPVCSVRLESRCAMAWGGLSSSLSLIGPCVCVCVFRSQAPLDYVGLLEETLRGLRCILHWPTMA